MKRVAPGIADMGVVASLARGTARRGDEGGKAPGDVPLGVPYIMARGQGASCVLTLLP